MQGIFNKLASYAALVGVIGAIGGGFMAWGEFNNRIAQLEDNEFIVDCREDIVKDSDVVSSEYWEGHIFDDYFKAEKQLNDWEAQLKKDNKKIFITNEVKTYLTVLGRKIIREESEREETQVKEKSSLWTVDLNTTFKNILFDCTEDELEQNVQQFVISELENLDWTYEKADVNVSKTMIK